MEVFHPIRECCDPKLIPHTRIHPLPAYSEIWIKREDETGAFTAAGKCRKYASLIPWLKSRGYTQVVIEGSEAANHVVAAAILLKEAGILPFFIVKQAGDPNATNAKLLKLLAREEEILRIPKSEWKHRESLIHRECANRNAYFIPEGASCTPALAGSVSLAEEILRQEQELNLGFRHVFMDAGTGFSAAACLLGLSAAGWSGEFHVVPAASDESYFRQTLESCLLDFENIWQKDIPVPAYHFHPLPAKSTFGKMTTETRSFIRNFARLTGILTDPIYNARLAEITLRFRESHPDPGPILMIHSGGQHILSGYPDLFLE